MRSPESPSIRLAGERVDNADHEFRKGFGNGRLSRIMSHGKPS